jgi:hypothetical protein
MNNMQISVAMNHADRISHELACARAFAAKHDPQLQWDVNYHVQAARLLLDSLAHELGCTVDRIAAPMLEAAE